MQPNQVETKNENVNALEDNSNNSDNHLENSQSNNQENYEDAARERGWRPKEEWSGDPDDWANAKQFVKYGEMMDKIHGLTQKVSSQTRTLTHVEDLIKKREELARQQERESLVHQRREAIQNGDIDAVEAFDQKIKKVESENSPREKDTLPELKDWSERHKSNWFNNDSPENLEMVEYSAKAANWIGNKYADLPLNDQLEKLETEMRRKFPHRFGNQKRNRPLSVESEENSGLSNKKTGSGKYNQSRITPDMRMVAKAFVNNGTFKSEQEYFDDFFKKYGDK